MRHMLVRACCERLLAVMSDSSDLACVLRLVSGFGPFFVFGVERVCQFVGTSASRSKISRSVTRATFIAFAGSRRDRSP